METPGVIIWGDSSEGSLIVWCADSEGLAYANGDSIDLPAECRIGDLVSIETTTDHLGRRICQRLSKHTSKDTLPGMAEQRRAAESISRSSAIIGKGLPARLLSDNHQDFSVPEPSNTPGGAHQNLAGEGGDEGNSA